MEFSQLKSQIMAMFMMHDSKHEYNHIWTLIYVIFSVTAAEHFLRNAPQIWKWLIFVFGLTQTQEQKQISDIPQEPEHTYSVSLVRKYNENQQQQLQLQNEMVEKVDAVIEYLSNLDSTLHVHLDGRYIIDKDCDLPVTTNLRASIKHIRHANGTTSIEILLYSNELRISAIRAWIDQIHEEYIYEKSNRLGHKTYYFNEIAIEPPRDTTFLRDEKTAAAAAHPEIRYRFDNANPSLHFTMNEFHTSKSFSNVYGSHVDELRERLTIFTDHPEWYEERGIPHTLGILLHGIPGAGKTSTIKAIANDTGRHIFNLSLRPYTTCKQLTNLFYNESVTVVGSGGAEHIYRIPLNKRIYVIEDIDCLTDVVLDRSVVSEPKVASHNEVLTLSFLLNLLDGVLETPGRILVITSNYPERIDKALIRPGRIDVKVEFTKADRKFIKDMMSHFYETNIELEAIPEALNGVFTPAEVMESLCMYFKDPDGALMTLQTRANTCASNGSSTTLEELMGSPAPTPSEVIAEYTTCPWTEFRLKAKVKVQEQSEVPEENRLLEAILKAGDEVKEEDLLEYVNGGSQEEKLEKVRLALKTFEEETATSRQILSHEIIENPDAANFAEAEGLVNCMEPMESFNTDPSIEEHFRKLFAEMSSSKGSVAGNYTRMNTNLRRTAVPTLTSEETDLVNRIVREMNGPQPDEESSSGEWIHPSDRSESSDSE